MIVLYSPDHIAHNPTVEYYDGQASPHAEQPGRITGILAACSSMGLPVRALRRPLARRHLRQLHSEHYIDFLDTRCGEIVEGSQVLPSTFIGDTYTPLTRHTNLAARQSARLAVTAAELVALGREQTVYALCRPPGHHAEFDRMMGYCYYNNAALAALQLNQGDRKVAILDLDYHHGNGTQQLFYDRSDILYVSLHADPGEAFPYATGYRNERGVRTGLGYNRNFPLSKSSTPSDYLRTLRRALQVVNDFRPDFVVLSLGFDTYRHDPIGNLGLDQADYTAMGALLASELHQPTVIIQEGGYNIEALGPLCAQFLRGYLGIPIAQ